MAGDWIKMRGNLWDDPRVAHLCDITGQSEAPVIGALYWLWAAADQHTETGIMPGLTLRQIDRKTGVQGFGQALCDVGWLADHPEGVRIIGFEQHNGASAKRRCSDAQRKASVRNVSASDADKCRTDCGQNAPYCGAREEKSKDQKRMSSDKPPTDIDARLAQVTDEAIEAYNAFAEPLGLAKALPVGMDKKRGYVRRSLKTIREVCRVAYGAERIEPQFWSDYFAAQAADDFIAGRTGRTKDHANWRPDFEYLTRPDVIAKAFERAAE
jgi:hypothetical protein